MFSSNKFTDFSFYAEEFNHNNTIQVKLQGEQISRGQIRYPVRGDNCTHTEIFDMKNFLGFIQDLKN